MTPHDSRRAERDPSNRRRATPVIVGRAVILLAIAAALAYVSAGLLIFGGVALSGCFFTCSEPHYLGGALAAAGFSVTTALALAAAIAALATVDFRRVAVRTWLVIAPITAVASVLIVLGVL